MSDFFQDNNADDMDRPRLVHSDNGRSGLVAEQIGKSFDKKRVVRNVSINVRRGEVVRLFGPNGAGKTTCFYMISGLVKNDEGRILLDQTDISDTPVFRRAQLGIGYLPQGIQHLSRVKRGTEYQIHSRNRRT